MLQIHLDCWVVWACLSGAIVTAITTYLVCCKCNGWMLLYKYKCWSSASVSDMHACRHKFTDVTVGWMQLLNTWEWPDVIVTDMSDVTVQLCPDKMKL